MITISVDTLGPEPCPSAGITVEGLSSGSEQVVTVWRIDGSTRNPVRGAHRLAAVDSFYVLDYEVPLEREVTYQVDVLSGADTGVRGVQVAVTIPSRCGYLQDPLDPSTAVPVHALRGTHGEPYLRAAAFTQLSYEASTNKHEIMGSRFPVSIGGHRQAPSGIPFAMSTTAAEENARLRELVMSCVHLVIRPLPEWGDYLPGSATYAAASVTELPKTVTYGGNLTHWETSGDIVRTTSTRLAVSLFSYQDVEELFATYADKAAAVAGTTYLDDQKQPSGSDVAEPGTV